MLLISGKFPFFLRSLLYEVWGVLAITSSAEGAGICIFPCSGFASFTQGEMEGE